MREFGFGAGMKLSKTHRRLVNKLAFPLIGLLMMTLAMAITGSS
jgi:hypothetical protein